MVRLCVLELVLLWHCIPRVQSREQHPHCDEYVVTGFCVWAFFTAGTCSETEALLAGLGVVQHLTVQAVRLSAEASSPAPIFITPATHNITNIENASENSHLLHRLRVPLLRHQQLVLLGSEPVPVRQLQQLVTSVRNTTRGTLELSMQRGSQLYTVNIQFPAQVDSS